MKNWCVTEETYFTELGLSMLCLDFDGCLMLLKSAQRLWFTDCLSFKVVDSHAIDLFQRPYVNLQSLGVMAFDEQYSIIKQVSWRIWLCISPYSFTSTIAHEGSAKQPYTTLTTLKPSIGTFQMKIARKLPLQYTTCSEPVDEMRRILYCVVTTQAAGENHPCYDVKALWMSCSSNSATQHQTSLKSQIPVATCWLKKHTPAKVQHQILWI